MLTETNANKRYMGHRCKYQEIKQTNIETAQI